MIGLEDIFGQVQEQKQETSGLSFGNTLAQLPAPSQAKEKFYGYETRTPYASEVEYFKKNNHVTAMAAEDGRIIFNPFSKLTPEQRNAVGQNEATRLWLRENKIDPQFNMTPEQTKFFAGTDYGKPENAMMLKHTLIGRILSGDPSAGAVTPMQKQWADWVMENLQKRK